MSASSKKLGTRQTKNRKNWIGNFIPAQWGVLEGTELGSFAFIIKGGSQYQGTFLYVE